MSDEDHAQEGDGAAGEVTSVFHAEFGEARDPRSPAAGQGPPPGAAQVVVTRGPTAGSRLVLDKAVTLAGRHPDSDLVLDDVTVSRRHAEFRVTGGSDVHIVDVGSLNGVYVNRALVTSAVLANGDEVQIGKFRLLFLR